MKFCQNAFKIYASYVVFYMVFSVELIRIGFLGVSLLHLKKTRSNKAFSLPEMVKRAAKAMKNKKAETCCLFLIAAPYFKNPYF
ncbi:hypothetical protein H3S90_06930 [Bartonella sp. W8097]|uniref:hypothetical protein n=1 Tax=Bartonella apihabitans TaxID=2750929 RepID=UPI0018DB1A63|nr:hypothetical protein [Bartonella apihabitans]MBI0020819.1 hypothetical protein [Bartonella apihabitans]